MVSAYLFHHLHWEVVLSQLLLDLFKTGCDVFAFLVLVVPDSPVDSIRMTRVTGAKCWTCTWPGRSSSCRTSSPGYPSPFAGPWLQALLWNSLGNVFTSWGIDSKQKLLLGRARVTGQRMTAYAKCRHMAAVRMYLLLFGWDASLSIKQNITGLKTKQWEFCSLCEEEQRGKGEGSALPGHTCGYSCRKLPQRWLVPGSRTGCWPIFGLELRSGYFSGRPVYFTVNSISLLITRYDNCYSNV